MISLFVSENGYASNGTEQSLQTLFSKTFPVAYQSSNECSRYDFYVNFTLIGLDHYFIQPPGYNAYYCAGRCPLPTNGTLHSTMQAMLYHAAPDRVPPPCCVPNQLSQMSVIHYDKNNNPVTEVWSDMIVIDCICK